MALEAALKEVVNAAGMQVLWIKGIVDEGILPSPAWRKRARMVWCAAAVSYHAPAVLSSNCDASKAVLIHTHLKLFAVFPAFPTCAGERA